MLSLLAIALLASPQDPDLPVVEVRADDTVIDHSCRVVVPDATRLSDRNGDGVIHVTASGITLQFQPELGELIAADRGMPWDAATGIGIRIDGQHDVTIRNAHCHRYRCGIMATHADGLVLDGCDVAGGFAQRLGSTPEREDGADWLRPHDNDRGEWLKSYGAGVYVGSSHAVTVRGCYARRRQNGLILDRVDDSFVYDNDFSFLSGWGIAMWRSNRNTICRNALDFCIRGYSHGVYNRGQDSAGLLVFEQCCHNVFAENSVTHGGDGMFCFAGREAVGETGAGLDPKGLGCNDNLLLRNDFSDAAAHGIEITFSFRNRIRRNRIHGNAICGFWGGYSQDTEVAGNDFGDNGGAGYGLERGAVNIEHGASNLITDNRFTADRCGVHLWWDDDAHLLQQPWARANHRGSTDNIITGNRFEHLPIGIQLRQTDRTRIADNEWIEVDKRLETDRQQDAAGVPDRQPAALPDLQLPGTTRPVGARAELAGRQHIVMGEWFPWDFEAPMVRRVDRRGDRHGYEVFAVDDLDLDLQGDGVELISGQPASPAARAGIGSPKSVAVVSQPGVHGYRLTVRSHDHRGRAFEEVRSGTLIGARWRVTVFPCAADPREDYPAWQAASRSKAAHSAELGGLRLSYGNGGPSQLGLSDEIRTAGLPADHFGTLARARLPLTAGRWRIRTTSDDGVRVRVDGSVVLENWTWHGPTVDTAEFSVDRDREVEIQVEHFELDGYAVLSFELEPVTTSGR